MSLNLQLAVCAFFALFALWTSVDRFKASGQEQKPSNSADAAKATPEPKEAKTEKVVFSGTVLETKKPEFGDEYAEPEFWFTVTYRVSKVCSGAAPKDKVLLVAHRYGTARNLKVGAKVCRVVEQTDEYRKGAQEVYQFNGIMIPESQIPIYRFAGVEEPCGCSG
jgi:hypothetical protein